MFRALRLGLLSQDQLDAYDPALMFTIPRLAIVWYEYSFIVKCFAEINNSNNERSKIIIFPTSIFNFCFNLTP